MQVLKACDCFDYQACEVADYRATPAAALVDEIRADWVSRLPGWDAALWGINAARLLQLPAGKELAAAQPVQLALV